MSKASSGKGKPNGSATRLPKMSWVNYDLTAEDKEWLADPKNVGELERFSVDDLIIEGFKYSLGRDARNSCYVASLTDKQEGTPFHNHCLTGRGATPVAARISLLYRHLVLAEGDWSFFVSANPTRDEIYS